MSVLHYFSTFLLLAFFYFIINTVPKTNRYSLIRMAVYGAFEPWLKLGFTILSKPSQV